MIAAAHLDPVLDDVLDARAINLAEQRLLSRSLVEQLLAAGPDDISAPLRSQLLQAATRALELAHIEGDSECSAAGRTDDLIRAARHAQLNGNARSSKPAPLTVKEIGRRLRPALAVLSSPERHHPLQRASAKRVVDEILDAVPAHALFTPSVLKELRATSYGLLEAHAQERTARAA